MELHKWIMTRSFVPFGTIYIFSCDQALYEWYFLSVCLSVCLSVRLSHLFDYVPIIVSSIVQLSGVITMGQGKVHAKGQGQRLKVKVTEVTTQLVSGV